MRLGGVMYIPNDKGSHITTPKAPLAVDLLTSVLLSTVTLFNAKRAIDKVELWSRFHRQWFC